MTIVDRYIFRTVIVTSLVALLVLLALEAFFVLLTELEDLGKGQYGVAEILQYVLLTLPRGAYELAPMALLLGGLLGIGSLATGSELVAMRGAGLSVLRLVGAAMQAGLVLGLAALLIGEFVAPKTEQVAQKLRSTAKSEAMAIRAGKGFWAREGDHFINVRAVLPGLRLAQIYIYEIGEHSELESVTVAQEAHYADDRWILTGVVRNTLHSQSVTTTTLDRLPVASWISPHMLDILPMDPEDLAIRDLLAYIGYLRHNGLNADTYRLAFWAKVLAPVTSLVMLFVAMPFAFGSQRSTGTGQRLLIGIFLGLIFFLANRMLGNVVLLYGYPPLLGASLPTLVFFGGGLYALRRMR